MILTFKILLRESNVWKMPRLLATSVGHTSALCPISFCLNSLPPTLDLIDTKLASFSAELSLIRSTILYLTSRIGQDTVEIGGVHFQSLAYTTSWAKNELSFNDYSVFQDVITLLDLIGNSNLSDNDFLDGKYKASRANYVNDLVA